jgi:hypothetical protein
VADAVGAVGRGTRRIGGRPGSAEEPAGVGSGESAAAAGATVTRRAVVIGNVTYAAGTTMGATVEPTRPLPGSAGDASAIAAQLTGRGYAVTTLADQTAAQIDAALRTGLTGLTAGAELAFYYSGHGTPEGLIGSDGHAFTPAQMLAIRSAALAAQVDLVIATDACHAGVFADAIRGAELGDRRAAAAAAAGGTGDAATAAARRLTVLDDAIAVQQSKNAYTTEIQSWWARRYVVEATLSALPPQPDGVDPDAAARIAAMEAWATHYEAGKEPWNTFVAAVNPQLATLRTDARAASLTLRALTLTPLSEYSGEAEERVQASLDDVDTLLNQVLTFAETRE